MRKWPLTPLTPERQLRKTKKVWTVCVAYPFNKDSDLRIGLFISAIGTTAIFFKVFEDCSYRFICWCNFAFFKVFCIKMQFKERSDILDVFSKLKFVLVLLLKSVSDYKQACRLLHYPLSFNIEILKTILKKAKRLL